MRRLLAALIILLPAAAAAHSWYDAECCNWSDCQPVKASVVERTSFGYRITLVPGDHFMVTVKHVFEVRQEFVRRSQDQNFHVCLYPSEFSLACFYVPEPDV